MREALSGTGFQKSSISRLDSILHPRERIFFALLSFQGNETFYFFHEAVGFIVGVERIHYHSMLPYLNILFHKFDPLARLLSLGGAWKSQSSFFSTRHGI